MGHQYLINYYTAAKIINLFGIILLFLMICISPHRLIYDEPHHIAIAKSIRSIGLKNTLLKPPSSSAPGPLYSFIQLSLIDLTSLRPPWIRFVNLFGLLATIGLLILTSTKLKIKEPLLASSAIMSIPFIYPAVGMALTEIPALLFFTLFCYFFLELIDNLKTSHLFYIISLAISAGLSLGLAVIGRQTYICVLSAVFIILKWDYKNWIATLAVFISTALASFWLFWIWGGLTPPGLDIGGLSFKHGILSFAYLGFATCFVCPKWFKIDKLIILLLASIIGFMLIFHLSFNYAPATSLAKLIISDKFLNYYHYIIDLLFIVFATLWVYSFCSHIVSVWPDKKMLLLYYLIFILSLTPIAISIQFSSRYVVTVLTLLVLILASNIEIGFFSLTRFIFGVFLGVASLATYYIR